MSDAPFLDCYKLHDRVPEMVPGTARRDWMDATPERYAYRCLPLTMANSMGWELLCPFELHVEWDGGDALSSTTVSSPETGAHISGLALSHFGQGIVTFHTGTLMRTPPGWAVWASGPPNSPKDAIAPLSGLVETDWLPFPFTMNWKMTRPGRAVFAKDEPFCFVTLMEHTRLDAVTPRLRTLEDDPQLAADYKLWGQSRTDFLKRLTDEDPDTVSEGWQRSYMKGLMPGGEPGSELHLTKRRLKAPE